jgi:hypothetical protein
MSDDDIPKGRKCGMPGTCEEANELRCKGNVAKGEGRNEGMKR